MENALLRGDDASLFYTSLCCDVKTNERSVCQESPQLWAERLAPLVFGLKQTRSYADILGALLSYYRGKHTRAWPSIPTLAILSGWSETQVKRVLAWARKMLGLRVLEGAELLDGPGLHLFTGARRGRHPVNCYEVGGILARLFPRSSPRPGLSGSADCTLPLDFPADPFDTGVSVSIDKREEDVAPSIRGDGDSALKI